jgi:4-amino-4-deoxy-L-arabinose transferase-like glycosyltransferase
LFLAFSYNIFGVNTFAYKLPAIVFILLAALYTFLFGKKFYSALHGWVAVIVLITAEHIIISNQDVRAEPFMTGLMIMALYHFAGIVKKARNKTSASLTGQNTLPWFHLIMGSLAGACLVMTKGLFTIIPLASGIGLGLIYEKNWKQLFNWRWIIVVVLVVIFLSPALYGYYQQFDTHPEKVIFGEKNISGVKFFLWTSQWGRFTNTGPIKGKGDITFFIHTTLWAFLPWAFAAFYSLFIKTKQLVRGITNGENFTYFGFITLFIIFSLSRFQLSFYLNPLFPLLSIVTTAIIIHQSKNILKTFSVIHLVLSFILIAGLVFLHFFFGTGTLHVDTIIVVAAGLITGSWIFMNRDMYLKKIFFATAMIVLSVNYYLNREFYPALLHYQAESEAAYFIRDNNIPASQVVYCGEMESVADVILHHASKVIPIDSMNENNIENKYVFTSPEGREKIDSLGLKYIVITQFEDFPVTRLTGKFINKKTRSLEVKPKYLLKVQQSHFEKPMIEVTSR